MTGKLCDLFAERLVEYADGELSPADADRVAHHLAGCPDCREDLRLLRRSLELARAVWREAASDAPPLPARRPQLYWRRLPAVAGLATCAVVLVAAVVWLSLRDRSHRDVNLTVQEGQTAEGPPTQYADVEALIAREGRSARLAAAVGLLSTQPGLAPYKDQAERYLAEAYRGTTAVAAPQVSPPSIQEPES